jgi:hypothetical protein
MVDEFLRIEVECYAGYRGEETPRTLRFGTRRVEVARVLDRWLAPDHRYFKVEGDDGGTYIVRHDVVEQRWELTMFEGGDST